MNIQCCNIVYLVGLYIYCSYAYLPAYYVFPCSPSGLWEPVQILDPSRGYHMAISFKMGWKGSIHQVLSISNDVGSKWMNDVSSDILFTNDFIFTRSFQQEVVDRRDRMFSIMLHCFQVRKCCGCQPSSSHCYETFQISLGKLVLFGGL